MTGKLPWTAEQLRSAQRASALLTHALKGTEDGFLDLYVHEFDGCEEVARGLLLALWHANALLSHYWGLSPEDSAQKLTMGLGILADGATGGR